MSILLRVKRAIYLRANKILLEAYSLEKQYNDDPSELGKIQFNMALNYLRLSDFNNAINLIEKSIQNKSKLNSYDYSFNPNLRFYEVASALNMKAYMHLKSKNYDSAIQVIRKSENELVKFRGTKSIKK